MIDSVGMGDDVGGVGSVGDVGRAQRTSEEMGAEVKAATDSVGARDVQAQAELTAGGDRFDPVAGLSRTDRSGPALKDGDWLHDPRQLTPEQADQLQKIGDDPKTHPEIKEDIRQFLEDYKNKRDSIFPDDPNPLPRPVPPARDFNADVG